MGVKKCHRNACNEIMCDKYSSEYGYICNECFEEMKSSRLDIETFMESPKCGERNYDYAEEFKD